MPLLIDPFGTHLPFGCLPILVLTDLTHRNLLAVTPFFSRRKWSRFNHFRTFWQSTMAKQAGDNNFPGVLRQFDSYMVR